MSLIMIVGGVLLFVIGGYAIKLHKKEKENKCCGCCECDDGCYGCCDCEEEEDEE